MNKIENLTLNSSDSINDRLNKEVYSGLEDYFSAAVLVDLIQIDGEWNIIFEKRSKDIAQGGEISLPGGAVDPEDNSYMDTAVRETVEELGCKKEDIEVIDRLSTLIIPSGMLIHTFVGILHTTIDQLTINKDEVDSLIVVPLSFFKNTVPDEYDTLVKIHPYEIDQKTNEKEVFFPAKKLGLPKRYFEPWGDAKHKMYFYHYEGTVIWGLTAKIMKEYSEQLNSLENVCNTNI